MRERTVMPPMYRYFWAITYVALTARHGYSGQPVKEKGPKAHQPIPAVRTDRYGDPLPPGALARMGTVRLRHRGEVWSVVFSADGKTVIAGGPLHGPPRDDGAIRFWDARTGKLVRRLDGQPYGSGRLALSPDGKLLASESGATLIWIWDLTTGKPVHKLQAGDQTEGNIYLVAFSPDGKTLAASGAGSPIQLWDVKTGKLRRTFGGDNGPRRLAYSPDGKRIAWSGDGSLRLWDVGSAKEIWRVPMSYGGSDSLAFSPDGKVLASGGDDGVIRLLESASGKELRCCRGHVKDVHAVAFSRDGKSLASGGKDETVRIWDVATGKQIHLCRGHQGEVYAVAFSPNGTTLASGSFDHTVRLWDPATGKERFPFEGHQNLVRSVAYSPDGKTLASGGFCNFGYLWNPNTARVLRSLPKCEGAEIVQFSPDGKIMVLASWEPDICLYDTAKGEEVRRLKGHQDRIYAVAFSPDGRLLASSSNDSTIRVWQVATGKQVRRLEGGAVWKWVACLAFSPDGRTLASGREDGAVRLHQVASGKEVGGFAGDKTGYGFKGVTSVAFSPDGRTLVTGHRDRTIRLWGIAATKELRCLTGHDGSITSLSVSADGRVLASASEDGTVRLWELVSGEEVRQFRGHAEEVSCVAFAPDGRTLATGSRDFTILIWDHTGFLEDGSLPRLKSTSRELAALWDDLGGRAPSANRAIWKLVAAGPQSIELCAKRLKPVSPVSADRLARLIRDLDHDQFAERQQATQELEKLGELAGPSLRRLLGNRPSLEARHRTQRLLARLEGTPPRLQELRALAVLEHIGTAEARKVLTTLSRGAPDARLTREAKGSLERLTRHPPGER